MLHDPEIQARTAGERLYHFHGGMRLRHNKKISCETPVEKTPLATRYFVPLLQHRGREAEPTVTAGQKVLKGDQLGRFKDLGGGCVHAPTSGTVTSIAMLWSLRSSTVRSVASSCKRRARSVRPV